MDRLRRVRLFHEFGRPHKIRPLALGLARLIVGNLASLLQVRLDRKSVV